MYIDHSRPPFIDIALPEAHILPVHKLVLLYSISLLLDFLLLRNECLVSKVISPFQLRVAMGIYHAIIPMVYISSYPPANILFAAAPLFLASYSAQIPTKDLTVEKWANTILKITTNEQDTNTASPAKVRIQGMAKVALGIFKIAFMRLFIDPLLPHHPENALEYSWLHPMSLVYMVLYGTKSYCMLGMVDVFMGTEQALFAWNMVQLFNSPILASSPRDFWSRRWNRVVRNLLHQQIFTSDMIKKDTSTSTCVIEKDQVPEKDHSEVKSTATFERRVTRSSVRRTAEMAAKNTHPITSEAVENHHPIPQTPSAESSGVNHHSRQNGDTAILQGSDRPSFWSTRRGRGLLAFIISGIIHELIIMSACRRITLENLVFFTLQGVACTIEVELRQGALKQEPKGVARVACISLQLLFMAITGRLFLGPYLRCNFFK